MDEIENPYSPGAGVMPLALVGRDRIIKDAHVGCERVRRCYPVQATVFTGLRGVGKTVLLACIRKKAREAGLQVIYIEGSAERSFLEMFVLQLRSILLKMPDLEHTRQALAALAGFARSFRVSVEGMNGEIEPRPGLADSGVLEDDLMTLLELAGEAAQAARTALAVLVDEMHNLGRDELAALGAGFRRASQMSLPLLFAGAGLPQMRGLPGRTKGSSERLFAVCPVGQLPEKEARLGLEKPARARNVFYTPDAAKAMVLRTQGYPYFIQELGKHAWNCAASSPISAKDVKTAARSAIASLDSGFFAASLECLTPLEMRYLYAMVESGKPYRSGNVSAAMQRGQTELAPVRASLMKKGVIYSPRHGVVAFAVPLFDEFLLRNEAASAASARA